MDKFWLPPLIMGIVFIVIVAPLAHDSLVRSERLKAESFLFWSKVPCENLIKHIENEDKNNEGIIWKYENKELRNAFDSKCEPGKIYNVTIEDSVKSGDDLN